MQRHHRDRDMLWVTSGLPFLTWATAANVEGAGRNPRLHAGSLGGGPLNSDADQFRAHIAQRRV